ncbi:DUF7507 domain-containing protein [Methanobrevibacter sp.]
MKYVKLNVLLVFLILIIMSVGMVSAAENVSMDSDVNNDENLAINQASTDVEIIGEDGQTASFTDLQNYIRDHNNNGVVELSQNYKYDPVKDSSNLKSGISISNLTINGKGITIDGNELARIFDVQGGPVILNNIKFINGKTPNDEDGGAVLLSSGDLTANNCQFENNRAEKYGGAIATSGSFSAGTITVNNCGFKDNTALYHGGAIYAKDLTVKKSSFDSNRVTTNTPVDSSSSLDLKGLGGAIYSSNANIRDSTFTRNVVANSGSYQINEGGGAITNTHKLDVDNCTFTENTGLKGGAILAVAENPSDLNPNNYVNIKNSGFKDNYGFDGGAICCNYNMTVDHCVFDGNVATGYGGGAINTGYKSDNNYFLNSIFYNNSADNYGGALSTSHSHIKNCTFQYNHANHGGAIFSLSFDIAKSQFKDNVATYGGNNLVVVDGFKKDDETFIPAGEYLVFSQQEVHDFTVDVLNGQDSHQHYIESGKYAGYSQYCVEKHLFLPAHTEGVMTSDLSYIINSINQVVVTDYIKIMFYLKDAYPEKYAQKDTQSIIWIFSDSEYWHSDDLFVKEIIRLYDDPNFAINKTSYILPNGTKMEYDMQLFLTPTDNQNMVLFKSSQFTPTNNETVIKETLNDTVFVGQDVQFRITVTNTGNVALGDVFVNDIDFSEGLEYKNWKPEKGNWEYENNGTWLLIGELEPEENASFIVIFGTHAVGELRNNVTSGNGNIALSNSTNTTRTKHIPRMSVLKLSNDLKVNVGQEVSFTIVVKNEGECDISGVYVVDRDYSSGLEYDYFVDPTGSWTYRGNNRWEYNDVLKVNESTKELILYFIATSKGKKTNTVRAGNNITDEIENGTNTTKVVKVKHHKHHKHHEHHKHHKHHKNKKHHDEKKEKSRQEHYKIDERATGNPLFALILVLISLGAITLGRKN